MPLWSVGGKWDINREFFLRDVNWLSNLAFRITYGKAGVSPSGGFGSQSPVISIDLSILIRSYQQDLSAYLKILKLNGRQHQHSITL